MNNLNNGVKAVKHYKNNKQRKPFWNMFPDNVPKENGAYLISIHHAEADDDIPEDEVWVAYWESDLRNVGICSEDRNDKVGGFWNWGVGGTVELEADVIAWKPLPRPAYVNREQYTTTSAITASGTILLNGGDLKC